MRSPDEFIPNNGESLSSKTSKTQEYENKKTVN